MLGNLLPGIREIRTPLASGYLWLLVVWLWLSSDLEKTAPIAGVPSDITHLAHYGGRIAVGIAISFAAYLIGILSQFINFPFVRLGTLIAYFPAYFRITGAEISVPFGSRGIGFTIMSQENSPPIPDLSDEKISDAFGDAAYEQHLALLSGRLGVKGVNNLYGFASEVAENAKTEQVTQTENTWFMYKVLAYLFREVPNEGNALVGRETELYSVYDRLISEYEFRVGISLPLAALVTTLALRWNSLWFLAIIPLLILLATGSQQRMAAGDLLADAVRLKRIEISFPAELSGIASRINVVSANNNQTQSD